MKNIKRTFFAAAMLLGLVAIFALPAAADQVFLDDVIIDGSLCVGFDCVNGESFGFDTIRMKENNIRLHAQDTSTSASFPTIDWRLLFNETSNGGLNKFSVECDGSRIPFTIEGCAPTNSLYVDDGGRIGFGTSNPVVELHVVDGNTPTLRLEQDGSDGFTPQTWDVAGNEANFFIRDATNGSKLVLRLKPGAPDASIFVATNGDVGLGTTAPDRELHVRDTEANATTIFAENTNGAAQNTQIRVKNSSSQWDMRNNTLGQLTFVLQGSTQAAITIDDVVNGENVTIEEDLTVNGTIFGTVSSSRELKTAIEPVDPRQVLAKVAAMPIATWNYNLGNRHDQERHLGPMAEDFHAAFGLGRDEASISLVDYSGVALAAIQGLDQEKDEEIARLEAENAALADRLSRLEAVIQELAAADR